MNTLDLNRMETFYGGSEGAKGCDAEDAAWVVAETIVGTIAVLSFNPFFVVAGATLLEHAVTTAWSC